MNTYRQLLSAAYTELLQTRGYLVMASEFQLRPYELFRPGSIDGQSEPPTMDDEGQRFYVLAETDEADMRVQQHIMERYGLFVWLTMPAPHYYRVDTD